MEDIDIIHKNSFGLTFCWKRCNINLHKKINFVFETTAFHLNETEAIVFCDLINEALSRLIQNKNETDKLVFIETPVPQVSLILDYKNLVLLLNLVEGTLAKLGVDLILDNDNKTFV